MGSRSARRPSAGESVSVGAGGMALADVKGLDEGFGGLWGGRRGLGGGEQREDGGEDHAAMVRRGQANVWVAPFMTMKHVMNGAHNLCWDGKTVVCFRKRCPP